jgi:hypothetical protein
MTLGNDFQQFHRIWLADEARQYLTIMVYHSYENNIEVVILKGDVWHEVTSLYRTVNAAR